MYHAAHTINSYIFTSLYTRKYEHVSPKNANAFVCNRLLSKFTPGIIKYILSWQCNKYEKGSIFVSVRSEQRKSIKGRKSPKNIKLERLLGHSLK